VSTLFVVARWWPKKWAVPTTTELRGETGYLVGYDYAWWQWRKRRRTADIRNLERFDWRSIRIGLRRPEDHWRNDESPVRPQHRLRQRRSH
jgi:hypothetical protein